MHLFLYGIIFAGQLSGEPRLLPLCFVFCCINVVILQDVRFIFSACVVCELLSDWSGVLPHLHPLLCLSPSSYLRHHSHQQDGNVCVTFVKDAPDERELSAKKCQLLAAVGVFLCVWHDNRYGRRKDSSIPAGLPAVRRWVWCVHVCVHALCLCACICEWHVVHGAFSILHSVISGNFQPFVLGVTPAGSHPWGGGCLPPSKGGGAFRVKGSV